MTPQVTVSDETIGLAFADLDAARSFFRRAVEEEGFLVGLDRELKQYSTRAFSATGPGGFELGFEATVIQVFAAGTAFRTAFQLAGWSESRELELSRKLAQAEGGGAPAPGAPPVFQIREMNVSQRMRYAMKAGRVERQILLRDTSPQVLLGLVANPRLEESEVLELVKSNYVTGAILKRVAAERRWMSNVEIRVAVVRSPKTPTPLALRLLETLRTPDLGILGKSGAAREEIRKAALRLYLQRISSRGI